MASTNFAVGTDGLVKASTQKMTLASSYLDIRNNNNKKYKIIYQELKDNKYLIDKLSFKTIYHLMT